MNCLQAFNQRQMETLRKGKPDYPAFGPGDTLGIYIKIKEGERERIQKFEGLCIGRRNAGLHSSFRVRRVSGGFGIERVFSLLSPLIERIELLRKGHVRRSKIYYVRTLSRKKARIQEKKVFTPRSAQKESPVSAEIA